MRQRQLGPRRDEKQFKVPFVSVTVYRGRTVKFYEGYVRPHRDALYRSHLNLERRHKQFSKSIRVHYLLDADWKLKIASRVKKRFPRIPDAAKYKTGYHVYTDAKW